MTAAPALELIDVHSTIGVSHILQGVSLSAPPQTVTVILGRNGVGKTSTMRAILGLNKRTGSIRFNGEEIVAEPTYRIIQRGISYVPEDRDIFRALSVEENLRVAERKDSEHRYDLVFELFPEMKERLKQQAGTLSGGQQQMLSLSRGLLNENELMLIDEPTKGLAPRVVSEVVQVLERIRDIATIVMVEQNLAAAKRLAGHVVVMAEGKTVAEGDRSLLTDEVQMRELLGIGTEKEH
ncbi:MAG: ABC transporter ATP-binding protein [Aeromicrobium sp.]